MIVIVVSALDEICYAGCWMPVEQISISIQCFFAFLIVQAERKKVHLLQGSDGKSSIQQDESLFISNSNLTNAAPKSANKPTELVICKYKVVIGAYDSFLNQLSILMKDIYKGKIMASSQSQWLLLLDSLTEFMELFLQR